MHCKENSFLMKNKNKNNIAKQVLCLPCVRNFNKLTWWFLAQIEKMNIITNCLEYSKRASVMLVTAL